MHQLTKISFSNFNPSAYYIPSGALQARISSESEFSQQGSYYRPCFLLSRGTRRRVKKTPGTKPRGILFVVISRYQDARVSLDDDSGDDRGRSSQRSGWRRGDRAANGELSADVRRYRELHPERNRSAALSSSPSLTSLSADAISVIYLRACSPECYQPRRFELILAK